MIRLTSNETNGKFNSIFNEDIHVPPNSSIALQGLAMKTASLVVDANNDEVEFQVSGTGGAHKVNLNHTATLAHGNTYNSNNYGILLADIGTKMNAALTVFGKELGTQAKCLLNNHGFIEIDLRQAPLTHHDDAFTENSVNLALAGDGSSTDYQPAEGVSAGSGNLNYTYLNYPGPTCKGAGAFRASINTAVVTDGGNEHNSGFIIALVKTSPGSRSEYDEVPDSDIVVGVHVPYVGQEYVVIKNGVGSTAVPQVGQTDVIEIAVENGKLRPRCYARGGRRLSFSLSTLLRRPRLVIKVTLGTRVSHEL